MYKLKNIENYPNAKTNNRGLKKLDNNIETLGIIALVFLVISLISLLIFIIALITHSQNEILMSITGMLGGALSSLAFIAGTLVVHLSDIENEIFINSEDYDIVLKEIEDEKYKEFLKQYTRLKEELEQEQEQEQEQED